jgi:adenosylcobinamide-GDP ribazoletransferase
MSLRGLRLAAQFLTRMPVPAVHDFSPQDLSHSAVWFPLVGACLGALLALLVAVCGHTSPALAGILGVVAWTWLTGALHLDGLADLTDALAAAHRDPQRFFAVLSDPRLGTFAVVSVVLTLMLKAATLALLSGTALYALPLIPAWARLGPLAWSRWLDPLRSGQAERFAWSLHGGWIAFWTVVLLAASAILAPVLCLAPVAIAAWGIWLRMRLGGMTGDCLGAGIEITEVALLLALVFCGTAGSLASAYGLQP